MGRSRTEFSYNLTRSIVSKYKKDIGLVELALRFGVSTTVIARILREQGVKIRGRGRPVTVA